MFPFSQVWENGICTQKLTLALIWTLGHLHVESQSLFTVPLVTMVYVISLITALLYLLPDFIWLPDTLFSNITTNLIFYGL